MMECQCTSFFKIFVGIICVTISFILFIIYKYRSHKHARKAQEQMNEFYINSYEPAPLCDDTTVENVTTQNVVTGKVGKHITVNGHTCLNLGTNNFFNLVGKEDIEELAIKSIQTYGVGSCGPRGFYGTVDVHLELEERIAKFMMKEDAVVYSYGFSTVASAIPAYAKRTDVIFVDEKISFAAQQGLQASRARVYYFKHNDATDLENKILEYNSQFGRKQSEAKKFLVLEGIYQNTGSICNIPEILPLRSKYKMRLFIDESYTIGILGKTGRGIAEHFNVDASEIDMSIGSLENLIGSIGGFCVGSHFIIEHQRLSGLGYCFSASLPPVLTRAAICAFDVMETNSPQIFSNISRISYEVQNVLNDLKHFRCISSTCSPIKYLKPVEKTDFNKIKTFVAKLLESELLVALVPNFSNGKPTSSDYLVKVSVNIDLDQDDMKFISHTLKSVEDSMFT